MTGPKPDRTWGRWRYNDVVTMGPIQKTASKKQAALEAEMASRGDVKDHNNDDARTTISD